MYFNKFNEFKNAKLNTNLLWDCDLKDFDYQKAKKLVVKRVIERGQEEDYYAIFNLYGGIEGVKEIIKTIPHLSKKDMNFVSIVFSIDLKELECYSRMLSMKNPMLY